MDKRTIMWRFSGPLRVLVTLTAVIYVAFYVTIWAFALLGKTELAYDFVDVVSTEPLSLTQIIFGMIFSGIAIGSMVLIAVIANSLLKFTRQYGFFKVSVAKNLNQLGYALILFWLGMMLTDNVMPWLLTKNLALELREEIEWIPLDANIIALLVGFVLILLSETINEARLIDEDNKQII